MLRAGLSDSVDMHMLQNGGENIFGNHIGISLIAAILRLLCV